MAQKLIASMPDNLDLDANYTIRFTAVDPSSGAVVPSVNISNAALLVSNLTASADIALQSGPFMLVPGPDA